MDGATVKARLIETLLWSVTVIAIATATLEWRHEMHRPHAPAPTIWPVASPVTPPGSDSLEVLAERIVDADVFRLDRKPATAPYRPNADTQVASVPATPTAPRPLLTLAGVVGGPPWAALLDGVPGHDGTLVVHRGESVAGLIVNAISLAGITVTGMDTTWRLVVKRPWP